MSDTETDNTDEPTKAELHDRVEKLESTVAKMMPSRRDALKLGAAGIAGAAGLSATSQSAEASTGSAGQIGDPNNRPDVFADTVDANQLTGVSTGGIQTKTRAFVSSNTSADPLPFDSVSYDPDNNFDTTNHEYIVPANGTYQLSVNVRLNFSTATGDLAPFNIEINGNVQSRAEYTTEGDFNTTSVTDIRELESGDFIRITNGGNVTITGSPASTFITIIRLE